MFAIICIRCSHQYRNQQMQLNKYRIWPSSSSSSSSSQRRPFPLRQWCIPLCFRFPPVSKKCSDSVENFPSFTFSRKCFWFSSAKISDDPFFSHQPQISIFPPIFPISKHFSPISRKLFFPQYFSKFPPVFGKFTCFLHAFCYSRFPLVWLWCIYASHNARTGRPWRQAKPGGLGKQWQNTTVNGPRKPSWNKVTLYQLLQSTFILASYLPQLGYQILFHNLMYNHTDWW